MFRYKVLKLLSLSPPTVSLLSLSTSHSHHLTTTLSELQSQLKSVRQHILYLKSALGPPKYPTQGPSTAAAVFVEEKAGNTRFAPGLGSAMARPSMKQLYK